jgi:Tol biopolymer transport system component
MKRQYLTTLAAIICATVTIGVHGSERKEPQEDTSSEQSSEQRLSEDRLYRKSKIAFISHREGTPKIYIMNTDGSEQKNLTNNPAEDWGACWSPDGKRIAFRSKRDGNHEIYIMNADGSEQKRLTYTPDAYERHLSWSPFLSSDEEVKEKE